MPNLILDKLVTFVSVTRFLLNLLRVVESLFEEVRLTNSGLLKLCIV